MLNSQLSFFVLALAALLLPARGLSQTAEEQIPLRLIAIRTEADAQDVIRQIESGGSFEAAARAHSTDPSAKDGGFLGTFHLTDLKPDLQRIVEALKPGQMSPATRIGGEFVILQRLTLEEANWIGSYNAGLAAFESARYEDAAQKFLQALPYAEKLTPVDVRLEDNLHGLAESYRLQKKYADAEPFYERYLALHWGGPGAPEVLDRLSALVSLAYFQDAEFAAARTRFFEAVDHSTLRDELFTAMSSVLFEAELVDEAEALMERAVRLFPESQIVHYRLAELYRKSWKPRKALEAFETLLGMKAPGDIHADVENFQRSSVYQKIGSIHTELAEFEQAAAAYKKALEFTPDSLDALLGLGDVYLQQGDPEDALSEYSRAVAMDAKSAAAHSRVADANLRMGRFAEASEAAAKALALDVGLQRAHFILATALVRMGAQEEGGRQLDIYRQLEAKTRAETDRNRTIGIVNREAGSKMLEGRGQEALEMLVKAVEEFPDSALTYMNLGAAQSKLGRHKDAVETFQNVITRNIADYFLVSWRLTQEYARMGDVDASRRHHAVYLQNIDLELRQALESDLK